MGELACYVGFVTRQLKKAKSLGVAHTPVQSVSRKKIMLKIFTGDNKLLIKRRLAEFDGELTRLDVKTMTLGEFRDVLSAQGLFVEKRLIVADETSANSAIWQWLTDQAESINDDELTTLALVETKADGRSKLIKQAKKQGWLEDYPTPNRLPEALTWLKKEAGELGLKLAPAELKLVIERVGFDAWALSLALEKLSLLPPPITSDLIKQYIAPNLSVNVFAVADALLAGQASELVGLIDDLEAVNANPHEFFGLITSQISNLLLIKALGKQRALTELKLHPFVADKLAQVANKTELATIKQMITILTETDDKIKTTGQDIWTLLKISLLQIANLVA